MKKANHIIQEKMEKKLTFQNKQVNKNKIGNRFLEIAKEASEKLEKDELKLISNTVKFCKNVMSTWKVNLALWWISGKAPHNLHSLLFNCQYSEVRFSPM